MILIAAVAVGVLGYRVNDSTMTEQGFDRNDVVYVCAMLGGPLLAATTAGLLVVRLFPPRPPRRELFRQPGFAAGCIALAMTSARFLEYVFYDCLGLFDDWFLAMEWLQSTQLVSMCIFVTLTIVALGGSWKAERGWIDRTLCVMATVWVIAGIALRLGEMIQRYELIWR